MDTGNYCSFTQVLIRLYLDYCLLLGVVVISAVCTVCVVVFFSMWTADLGNRKVFYLVKELGSQFVLVISVKRRQW